METFQALSRSTWPPGEVRHPAPRWEAAAQMAVSHPDTQGHFFGAARTSSWVGMLPGAGAASGSPGKDKGSATSWGPGAQAKPRSGARPGSAGCTPRSTSRHPGPLGRRQLWRAQKAPLCSRALPRRRTDRQPARLPADTEGLHCFSGNPVF